jgi:hypothetical protein
LFISDMDDSTKVVYKRCSDCHQIVGGDSGGDSGGGGWGGGSGGGGWGGGGGGRGGGGR